VAAYTTSSADLEIYDPELAVWWPFSLADEFSDDGVKLPKTTTEALFGAEADAEIRKRLHPQVQEDWTGGIGISYDWAPGLYAGRSPGYICPAGAATDMTVPAPGNDQILYWAEYGGDLFCAQAGADGVGTGRVYRSVGGSGAFAASLTLGANEYVRGLLVADNGSGTELLYAFSSDSGVQNGRMHSWNGTAWTSTAAATFGTNGRAAAALVFWETDDGIGAHRIVTISGERTIAYTVPHADPMLAASWVEGVRIGGSRGQLRQIAAAKTHVYVSAEDGLFDLDELGNSPNLLNYVGQMVQPGNGYAVQYHDGAVFYSLGAGLDRVIVEQQGMLQETPGQCGPAWGHRAENPVTGMVTAMCVDQGFLVAALFNQSTRESYICYGKSRAILGIESPNPMIWYGPEVVLTSNYRVTSLHVSSLVSGSRRLWIGSITDDDLTARISWVSLPLSGAPLQDIYSLGGHKFNTGQAGGSLQPYARLYLLLDTWEDKPSLKILHQHALGTRGLSIVGGVNDGIGTKLVEYDRADPLPGSTSWGTGTDVTTSPSQTIAPSSPNPVKGYEIGRRIDFISPNGAASTPKIAILNSLRTTAWIVAPSFSVRTVDVHYGAGVVNLANARSGAFDPDYITERLDAIIRYGPTTMRDRRNRRWTVKLEQAFGQVQTFHDEPPGVTVRAKLEITLISALDAA
jgi:hypothetical protein